MCGKLVTNYNYQKHFSNSHNISKEEYFNNNQNQLVYQTKNYVYILGKIIPKGQIKRKNYGKLTLTQVRLLLLVKAYHIDMDIDIKLNVLEDLMFNRAHPEMSSAYELFNQYKAILAYIKPRGKKVGENIEYLTIRYGKNIAEKKLLEKSNKVKGANNPGYQHNGKYSKWSKNFVHGYKEEEHNIAKQNHSKWVKDHPAKNYFHIDYWIKKYNGDVKKAETEYKKSQTRNVEWFVNKYGKLEGKKRHKAKTEKWMKNYKKCNFSQISQELFNEIIASGYLGDVYYATYDRNNMSKYTNKEYILTTKESYVRPDFIDLKTNKIIEFDGDYWHSDAKVNYKREQSRDKAIKEQGYKIFHVREQNFRKNKEKVIKECLDFLQSK